MNKIFTKSCAQQMLLGFLGILLPYCGQGQQTDDASEACREAKIRAFGMLPQRNARIQYPGDATIDVHYYKLDLSFSYNPQYMRAATTVGLRAVTDNLTRFYLDFNDTLRVDSVKANDKRLSFQRSNRQLVITPDRPLRQNAPYTVTVYYQGRPDPTNSGTFAFSTHGTQRDPAIWSLSEPYGAREWFPCKDTPADKADSSDVWITAPRFFVSVSNGKLENVSDNSGETRTYRWRNRYPIATYLISVAMSNYTLLEQSFNGMPVTHYLFPESLTAANRQAVEETTTMLGFFSDYFGPYPFLREKYGHAQFGWGGGMEHQTISSMGGFTRTLIAHELAHQWFGDKITTRTWEHIWLNEGFASYAEALYTEYIAGKNAFQTSMASFFNRARNAQGTLFVQDISNPGNIFNSNRTYAKGATVLHMLRGIVGEQVFKQILREYAGSALAYGTATTEDFQTVVNRVSGRSLDYFFKQWIYGENYPTYRVSWSTIQTANPNRWTIQLRLEQSTGTTNPAFFQMPVPVRISTPTGDTTITVLNNAAEQTFALTVGGRPSALVIDPDNWLLKRVESTQQIMITGNTEPISRLTLEVAPNPAHHWLTLQLETPSDIRAGLVLTDLLGRQVASLPEKSFSAGKHTVQWDVSGLSPGRYTLRLNAPGVKMTKTVLLAE